MKTTTPGGEFLQARTYQHLRRMPETVRDLASLASRLRIYSLLADLTYPRKDTLSAQVDAVLDDSVGPEDYHRDDAMWEAVVEHFEISLERWCGSGGTPAPG